MPSSNNTTKQKSVLIVLATGKMGQGISQAFLDSGKYKVFGTSRDPNHPKLLERGIVPIDFRFGDKESMMNALKKSDATVAVLITDLIRIAVKSPDLELQHGQALIDACKEVGTLQHVILCSNHCCEVSADICAAKHMTNKLAIETYLKMAGLASYSILRPASFMENYDDAVNYNPLTRGYLSDLYPRDANVCLVATIDIGKAAVIMTENRDKWKGKTLDCASCISTGVETAIMLSSVSGEPCVYKSAPPSFILWFISRDLYQMVKYVSAGMEGWDAEASIKTFRDVVPDALGIDEWFKSKGVWSDGTKFGETPVPQESSPMAKILVPAVVLAAAAVAVGLVSSTK
jgi:uncharacterized protein YbjT (DUF2867 family)